MINPAYSVSFLLSINIFLWQDVLYFPNKFHISLKNFILLALVMKMKCVCCEVGSGTVYYLDDIQASSECQVKQNPEIEMRSLAAPFVM